MKILLLGPSFYTLHKTIKLGFERLEHTVYHHDYRTYLKSWQQNINIQIFRFPLKIRDKWEKPYFDAINKKHLEIFEEQKPDIVFIYNNEGLLPGTVEYFRGSGAKIIFIMGDSPYYTPTNKYYMHLFFYSDLIISPDSFWKEQLELLGIKNIILDFPGFDDTLMNYREPTSKEREKYNFDVLFVGTGYVDAWGYKRALFANSFAGLNLKVFGNKHWLKWLELFPELKAKFELLDSRINEEQLIIMSKCAKVYPVDANPAILHGIHLRVFDCIAMGVLPLVEYRKDHDIFFSSVELPSIKNYNDAEELAKKLLSNNNLRERILTELREFTYNRFRPELVLQRVLSNLQ